jgi:hypothetical protein
VLALETRARGTGDGG